MLFTLGFFMLAIIFLTIPCFFSFSLAFPRIIMLSLLQMFLWKKMKLFLNVFSVFELNTKNHECRLRFSMSLYRSQCVILLNILCCDLVCHIYTLSTTTCINLYNIEMGKTLAFYIFTKWAKNRKEKTRPNSIRANATQSKQLNNHMCMSKSKYQSALHP